VHDGFQWRLILEITANVWDATEIFRNDSDATEIFRNDSHATKTFKNVPYATVFYNATFVTVGSGIVGRCHNAIVFAACQRMA
jgi:hypothetical protein